MNVPGVFRELFTRCGEISEVGVIPLRVCLIEILQNWSSGDTFSILIHAEENRMPTQTNPGAARLRPRGLERPVQCFYLCPCLFTHKIVQCARVVWTVEDARDFIR